MIRYIVVFGLVLVALATGLTPSITDQDMDRFLRPERFVPEAAGIWSPTPMDELTEDGRRARLNTQRTALRRRLNIALARDAMLVPTLDAHTAGDLYVGATPDADPGQIEALRQSYRQWQPSGDVAVGVARLPWGEGAREGNGIDRYTTWMYGETEGQLYCIAFRNVDPRGLNPANQWPSSGFGADASRAVDELGVCAFIAKYGLPGESIDAWLRERGFAFARRAARFRPPVDVSSDAFFGGYYPPGYSMEMRSCTAGWDDSCAALLFPEIHVVSRFYQKRALGDMGASVMDEAELRFDNFGASHGASALAQLESDYPEAFAEFWISDAPVEEAFADAFGRTTSDWLQNDFLDVRGARFGPAASGVEWMIALAWAGVFLLLGVLRDLKRRAS